VLYVGSGLIYAAIIVMWALYFIPRWLRRHEELSESRSVEKFERSMRILSRRAPTADQRYIVMPPKPEPAVSSASAASRAPSGRSGQPGHSGRSGRLGQPSDVRSSSQPAPRRKSSKTFRRRRVLVGLVLLTLVVTAATPFTPVPWWGPLVGAVAILVDLAHLRVQTRRRHELTRTRHAVRKRLRSRLRRVDSAERLTEARQLLAERRTAAEAERVEADRAAREAARRAAEGWQPTPVPLPTYVTKPVAPRVGRPIDLTRPGAWTEAQGMSAGAMTPGAMTMSALSEEEIFDQTSDSRPVTPRQTAAGQPTSDQAAAGQTTSSGAPSYDDYVAELDEILERRPAVND
jgi:hypothetical protein